MLVSPCALPVEAHTSTTLSQSQLLFIYKMFSFSKVVALGLVALSSVRAIPFMQTSLDCRVDFGTVRSNLYWLIGISYWTVYPVRWSHLRIQ